MHNELIRIVVVIFALIFLEILYIFALSKLVKYLSRKGLLEKIDRILNIILAIAILWVVVISVALYIVKN